jgi:hypothetical protein
MGFLPSLYKARVPTKQPVCAICLDRTRGKTQRVSFGYGVSVFFCQGHASVEFLTRRSGRDLVVSLSEVWKAVLSDSLCMPDPVFGSLWGLPETRKGV